MLIAIAGRKSSGKTTLCQEILERGFVKVSFADKLKKITANLYDWQVADLYSQQGKEDDLPKKVCWDQNIADKLSGLIGVDVQCEKVVEFKNRRESLQFIGTDVIRKIDPQFHVSSLKSEIFNNGHVDFVIDDLRFPNELEVVKELMGTPIYVMRPYLFEYSNHASEISLLRHNFDNIVINDGSKHKLIRKFNMFLDGLLSKRKKPITCSDFRKIFQENNGDTKKISRLLGCSRDKIVWWATKFLINIYRNKYECNHDVFSVFNEETAYWAGVMSSDGTIKHHQIHNFLIEFANLEFDLVEGFKRFIGSNKPIYTYKQKTNGKLKHSLTISSRYIADDFKLWNIEPLTSRVNKIPDCLKNKPELLRHWAVGLLDGDGLIYEINDGDSFAMSFLASKEIVDYLSKFFQIDQHCMYPEKDIENLFVLKYHGKYAVQLYKQIYTDKFGIERKWAIPKKFLDKAWHH